MKKNRKRLLFLVLLMFFLGAGYLLVRYVPSLTVSRPKILFSLPDSEIADIALYGDTTTQTLVKKNDIWYVMKNKTEYRADKDKVANLLEVLRNLTQDTIVSRNSKKHKDEFGIDTSRIVVKGKRSTFILYAGFPYIGNDSYARLDKQNEVFVGKNLATVQLNADYRDLAVPFMSDAEKVRKIEVDYNGKTVLTKSNEGWRDQSDNAVPQETIDSYLGRIQLLQATDLLTENPADSDVPALALRLTVADRVESAQFYDYQDEYSLMTVPGSKYSFVINRSYVDGLRKSNEDFLNPESTNQP